MNNDRDRREIESAGFIQAMPGVGPRGGGRLLRDFGSSSAAVDATDEALAETLEWSQERVRIARASVDRRDIRGESRRLRGLGGAFVMPGDRHYPRTWEGMIDPPLRVGVVGDPSALVARPGVAVVGARRSSAIGQDLAARFATVFAESGWMVCSGGARGIDAAAHRACLRTGGPTVAILGSGLGNVYPPEHDSLFIQIAEQGGAVISELPVQAPPRPGNFPLRNRLVAGLCVGVLVVEAGGRSGALITAGLAAEDYGREVMAVPGRSDTLQNAGCHQAIREGWANLVDDPEQAIELLERQNGLLGLLKGEA